MNKILRVCGLYNSSYDKKFDELYDYDPIIHDFGNVLFKVDDNDYQGDSYVLYGNISGDGAFGFLNFGWGSCCGCDALQACESWDEVQELYNDLKSSVKWFDNLKEAYNWFIKHDWCGDYSTPEKKKFVRIATFILKTLMTIDFEEDQ